MENGPPWSLGYLRERLAGRSRTVWGQAALATFSLLSRYIRAPLMYASVRVTPRAFASFASSAFSASGMRNAVSGVAMLRLYKGRRTSLLARVQETSREGGRSVRSSYYDVDSERSLPYSRAGCLSPRSRDRDRPALDSPRQNLPAVDVKTGRRKSPLYRVSSAELDRFIEARRVR